MSEPEVIRRMERALESLAAKWPGRKPKAFYLGPADWDDFLASNPDRIHTLWNCKPAEEPAFRMVPVRPSKNVPPRQSRLYDATGTGHPLAASGKPAPPPASKMRQRWRAEADAVAEYLDGLSRERMLEDWETDALEAAILIQDGGPTPPRRPWGWTRLLAKAKVKRSGRRAGE